MRCDENAGNTGTVTPVHGWILSGGRTAQDSGESTHTPTVFLAQQGLVSGMKVQDD